MATNGGLSGIVTAALAWCHSGAHSCSGLSGAEAAGVCPARGRSVMGRYQQAFLQSITDPDAFWGGAAELISWYRNRL
jgi:hypothetical protein